MIGFQRFVGIDWSGAKGGRLGGIAVAICDADGTCRVLRSPSGRSWSRREILDLLLALEPGTLAGLDFAFSLPWPAEGPLPRGLDQPDQVGALWEMIERVCAAEPDFYAGPIYRPQGGWLADYMFTKLTKETKWVGSDYQQSRLRATERALARAPAAAFKVVGAATVGPSSFAGMRVLLALRRAAGANVAIWPFDEADPTRITLVEIYPGFYKRLVHGKPKTLAECEDMLAHFGGHLAGSGPRDGHELDALVSAAAMRAVSRKPEPFAIPSESMRREGWIFGVPVPARHRSAEADPIRA